MYNPGRGWVYMCVAGSGGGTRYARLPPVIEVIPHSGYLIHAARQKGLKGLKGILVARLPLVIEVIPHSGYLLCRLRFSKEVSNYRLVYHRLANLLCQRQGGDVTRYRYGCQCQNPKAMLSM